MTDKQIIIDGVEVSGCKYYVENNGIEAQGCYELTDLCECNNENEFCDNNPNCYYKQLKRKEQECEELKKIINEAKNSKLDLNSFFAIEATVGEYQLELDQLKAENENWKKEYWKLEQGNDFLAEKNSKLRGCLTEIKEIAEPYNDMSGNCVIVNCFEDMYKILQKISECEEQDGN